MVAEVLNILTCSYFCLWNKAKRFAKQQRSNIINALAYVYCYFLRAVRNGDHPNNNSYIVQLLTAAGPL